MTISPPAPADDEPGARSRQHRAEVLRQARAYSTVMAPHAFFIGRTAAVIYGAPIENPEALEVGVVNPARAPRGKGIRAAKVAPGLVHVRSYEGLQIASPASTWAMLGRELTVRELVILGDALVAVPRGRGGVREPRRQLTTITQLRAAVEAGRRRGVPKLRDALELVRVGSASPLETEHRLNSDAAGIPTPELDVEIRDGRGRLLGISEIVHRAQRVAVEIEGDHHRTSKSQWDRDLEKYAAYTAEGWEVVRLTSRHIRGTSGRDVALVRDALARRGWHV